MHRPLRAAMAAAAMLAALTGTLPEAEAQNTTTATQPNPPGTPLVTPSDRPVLGGVTPLSASGQDTLTIAPGAVPPPAPLDRIGAPAGKPAAPPQ